MRRNDKIAIALDLDGTLVFPHRSDESPETDIVIPGRSRPTFLSAAVARSLARLSSRHQVYVASARNAMSVRGLIAQLPDVAFAGFVLEGGLVTKPRLEYESTVASLQLQRLVKSLQRALPSWEFVAGYEQMCCCLAPQGERSPLDRVTVALGDELGGWHAHQERHKTFLCPRQPCKLEGLRCVFRHE